MLNQQEIEAALQTRLDKWKEDYPEPWVVISFIRELRSDTGISPMGAFIESLLPPGWMPWALQVLMHKAKITWGMSACAATVRRAHENLIRRLYESEVMGEQRSHMTDWHWHEMRIIQEFWPDLHGAAEHKDFFGYSDPVVLKNNEYYPLEFRKGFAAKPKAAPAAALGAR